MGMFDSVYFVDGAPKCGEGHDLAGEEFQTKDLDCNLDQYAIEGGILRLVRAHPVCKTDPAKEGTIIDVPTLNVYLHCLICAPVWGIGRDGAFLQSLEPWNEWILHFEKKNGLNPCLAQIEIVSLETRAGVRKRLAGVWPMLEDDDPRAIEETKKRRAIHEEFGGMGRGALERRPKKSEMS